MKTMTALKPFYHKAEGAPRLILRGETFSINNKDAAELEKKRIATVYGEPYETATIQPEIKENQIPEPEPKEQPGPDPTTEPEPLEEKTNSELKQLLKKQGIDVPSNAKKAELIDLYKGATK